MTGYLDIFSRSPFSPLQRHMNDVMACIGKLSPFMKAIVEGQLEQAAELQDEISKLERHADKQHREVMRRMPRGVFMPVARQDLLDMLSLQSELAYKVDDIAGRLTSRPVKLAVPLPEPLGGALTDYVDQLGIGAKLAQSAIDEMDELLTTGFGGKDTERVHSILDELNDAEVAARKKLRRFRREISATEEELPVLEVIYMFRISDRLAELQHLLKRHGSQFGLLMAKA